MKEKLQRFFNSKIFFGLRFVPLLVFIVFLIYEKPEGYAEFLEIISWAFLASFSIFLATYALRKFIPSLQKFSFIKCSNYVGYILGAYFVWNILFEKLFEFLP